MTTRTMKTNSGLARLPAFEEDSGQDTRLGFGPPQHQEVCGRGPPPEPRTTIPGTCTPPCRCSTLGLAPRLAPPSASRAPSWSRPGPSHWSARGTPDGISERDLYPPCHPSSGTLRDSTDPPQILTGLLSWLLMRVKTQILLFSSYRTH